LPTKDFARRICKELTFDEQATAPPQTFYGVAHILIAL
jgi:hypothetical protein